MRHRGGLIFLGLLLLAGGAFFIWWKSGASVPQKREAAQQLMPKMSMASVNISDIDDERIKLTSKVKLSNPLPVDLHTKNLNYELYIDSVLVMKEAYNKPIFIKSSDSTIIQLPMELMAKPMAKVLKYFEDKKIDSADYTMKASFTVDVPVAGNRNFDMDITKRLPAVRLPKVKVKDVDLNALRLKKKGVDVVAQVTNPNLFPLKLKDGAFTFAVEDDMEMNGTLEKVINIPARGTQDVSMHAKVTEGKMLKVGWKLLTDKDDTKFTYNFRCKLASDNGLLQNSAMATSMQGTLGELVNVVKKVK